MNPYATRTAADTLHIERLLPGPIERVWQFLVDPDKRKLWLAAGEMQLQTGGSMELVFRNSELTENDDPVPAKYACHEPESRVNGEILAVDPLKRLAFTWGDGSQVHIELSKRDDQVHLLLIHSQLSAADPMLSVAGGWHTHLDILLARLNGVQPEGFWRRHTQLEAEYLLRFQ